MIFTRPAENIDVWALPVDANKAIVRGELTRITTDPSIDQRPSLSADGKRVAWETTLGGNFEVWVKDLATGQSKAITSWAASRAHAGHLAGWFNSSTILTTATK